MTKFLIILASVLFSFHVSASNNTNSVGGTQLGPLVNCELESGDMKYIPTEMCRISKGKAK
ncbi:hypothetical protein L4C37_18360 [Vibrio kagoshimensis]|uniref:Uncharacterized protein n=1 Tax=Vibrio gallaecicus TaxID=552386 RepID=A0ABV4NB83_9VIBR